MTDADMLTLLDYFTEQPLAADELPELAPVIVEMMARLRDFMKAAKPKQKNQTGAEVALLIKYGVKRSRAIRMVAKKRKKLEETVEQALKRHMREAS